jgi:fluoroacetyl-CoA thioesterase
MAIEDGSSGTVEHRVTDADLASAVGSGDVPVLATPVLIAWCEAATVAAVAPGLEPGQTTVGTRVAVDHLRATPTGATVTARAVVTVVDGPTVTFAVEAEHRRGADGEAVPIARGEVVRAVVDRDRFVQRSSS